MSRLCPSEAAMYQSREIGTLERILSTAAGSKLVWSALTRHRSSLGLAMAAAGGYLAYRGIAGRSPMQSVVSSRPGELLAHPLASEVQASATITINRPPDELYQFWRDFRNLPRIMPYIDHVETLDENRSRWSFERHAGTVLEWEAMIVQDRPGELLEWSTVDAGRCCRHHGTVEFTPGERGTVVRVTLIYRPVGGAAGALLAKLFRREPGQMLREDLRRLKQLMETGEIADNSGPSGRAEESNGNYGRRVPEPVHSGASQPSVEAYQDRPEPLSQPPTAT